MTEKKLKAYFFHHVDDTDYGDIIIAHTAKEALKIGYKDCEWIEYNSFIEMRAKWLKNANADGLKVGILTPDSDEEWFDAIKRNILDYPDMVELPCPLCKQRGILSIYVGEGNKETVMCEACSEKDE